jgi:predicted secreted protein
MNTITINFTTRATYLEFKAEWSAQYQATVEAIRQDKLALKECHRKNQNTFATYKDLRELRQDIVDLAAIKAEAKVEANRQYQAENAAPVAVAA